MSAWIQSLLPTNSRRKRAAVLEPPPRSTVCLRSAMSLRSCSLRSSRRGIRQNCSPASLAAVANCAPSRSCVVALGKHCSGFYATSDRLGAQFATAAKEAGEQFWRMPLLDDLKEQLRSDIADLKHTEDRWGGSITAALFLREFVGKSDWIHADIAGPSWSDKVSSFYPKGGTGHGVLTFLRFVEQH